MYLSQPLLGCNKTKYVSIEEVVIADKYCTLINKIFLVSVICLKVVKEVSQCNLNPVLYFSSECHNLTFDLSPPTSLSLSLSLCLPYPRYSRQPGGERAPAHGHDWPVEQPEGAAPGGPRGAEEAGRLTDGEAEAADGAGQAAAGPGTGALHLEILYCISTLQRMSTLTCHLVWH